MVFTFIYFTLVESNSTSQVCGCIEPCTRSVFEPVLSYAALSFLGVDEVLGQKHTPITKKYHAAFDVQDRVNKLTFVKDLNCFRSLLNSINVLKALVHQNARSRDRSSINTRVQYSLDNLEYMFSDDRDNKLFPDIKIWIEDFEKAYGTARNDMHASIRTIEENIAFISRISTQSKTPTSLSRVVADTYALLESTYLTLYSHYYAIRTLPNMPIATRPSRGFVGSSCWSNYLAVRNLTSYMTNNLKSLNTKLHHLPVGGSLTTRPRPAAAKTYAQRLVNYAKSYREVSGKLTDCFDEYYNTLLTVQKNLTSMKFTSVESNKPVVTNSEILMTALAPLQQYHLVIKGNLDRYIKGHITKLQLSATFNEASMKRAMEKIRTCIETMKSILNEPLRLAIMYKTDRLQTEYMSLMELAAALERYYQSTQNVKLINLVSKMGIWERPITTLDNTLFSIQVLVQIISLIMVFIHHVHFSSLHFSMHLQNKTFLIYQKA